MNHRFIALGKNKQGDYDCDHRKYDSLFVIAHEMPIKEFNNLYNSGVFDKINERFDLLIDDYESETIPASIAADCLKIVKESNVEINGVFAQSLKEVVNYGTRAFLEF